MPLPSLAHEQFAWTDLLLSLLPKLALGTDIITKLHFNLNGHFLACNQDGNSRYPQRSSIEILQDDMRMSFTGEHYFYAN